MRLRFKIMLCVAVLLFAGTLSWQLISTGLAEQANPATLSGHISDNGMLVTDDGDEFNLSGKYAEELKQMPGQQIDIMGTVKEEGGERVIEVQDYRFRTPGQEEQPRWFDGTN